MRRLIDAFSAEGRHRSLARAAAGTAEVDSPGWPATIEEFTTIANSASLGQAFWFAGLAAGGVLLVLLARRRAAALALIPAVAGLLVALPLFHTAPAAGLRP